jgi:hypothetical protein
MERSPLERPDIDELFKPKRFRILPALVILGLCVFGIWMMTLGPKTPPPRNLPPFKIIPPPGRSAPPRPPFTVTLMPPQGWCCAGGTKLSETSRTACETAKGVFFETEEQARTSCAPTATSGSPRGPGKGP